MDSTVPMKLIAGDTWQWERDLPDYPAGTWVVSYYLKNDCGEAGPFAGTPDGTKHLFSIAASATADIDAGTYRFYAIAVSGALQFTVDQGWVEVGADPRAGGNLDARTQARRTLDAINARLEGRASQDQMAMSVNGRSISRIPLPELLQLRTTLQNEVKAEDDGETGGRGRDIKVRMVQRV